MNITYQDLERFIPNLKERGEKKLLHVGCGTAPESRLPECFRTNSWAQIRLDIDPAVKPDVIASLTDMSAVPTGSIDAVWSSHNLEHLEGFQVPDALKEMLRVLKPGGFSLITLPDLMTIAKLIADGRVDDILYKSPAGPIAPIDMLFGHQRSIARGNRHMAHRTAFTAERLQKLLVSAGFSDVRVTHGSSYDLWAVAVKSSM